MTATPTPSVPRSRFIAGDPIRGLACVAILIYHCAYASLAASGIDVRDWDVGYGTVGAGLLEDMEVALFVFLVLSGFLIGRPFLKRFIDGREPPATGRYARHRFLRIMPAYWVVLTVLLLRHKFFDGYLPQEAFDAPFKEIAGSYLFLVNHYPSGNASLLVGQSWTLEVELFFYAAMPVAAYILYRFARPHLDRRGRIAVVYATIAALLIAGLAIREVIPNTLTWQRSPVALLFGFAPGLFLAALDLTWRERFASFARSQTVVWTVLAIGIAMTIGFHFLGPESTGFIAIPAPGWRLWQTLSAGFLVAAPLLLQWSGRPVWKVLDNRLLHWFGERSYSFYLWHQGVAVDMLIIAEVPGQPRETLVLLVALTIPVSAALATVTYHLVERPAMALARRYDPQPSGGRA